MAEMNFAEKQNWAGLTPFQKELVKAIRNMGFRHARNDVYVHETMNHIKVKSLDRWDHALKLFYTLGSEEKVYELKRFLNM